MDETINMSEWFMVGITLIYAIVTIFILSANKQSVNEMKLSRELAYRPEVIAFLYEKQGGIYFQIKNIGSRAAFDTTVKLNPRFSISTYIGDNNFMTRQSDEKSRIYYQKNIKVLAPNQKLETFVQIENQVIDDYNNCIETGSEREELFNSKVELIYYSYDKEHEFNESYDITLLDYQNHPGIIIYGVHEGVKELNKMNEKLSKINSKLK